MNNVAELVKILEEINATAEICPDGTTFIRMGQVTRTHLSPDEFMDFYYECKKNIIGTDTSCTKNKSNN